MKSLYDVTFNKMKYSSVRLLAAALCLVFTAFVIFEAATDWFACIRGGKYIAIGAMAILFIACIIGIFAFDFTFDISRLFLPVLCVLGTVYEFYLYFRAKRLDEGDGDKGKQEVRR